MVKTTPGLLMMLTLVSCGTRASCRQQPQTSMQRFESPNNQSGDDGLLSAAVAGTAYATCKLLQ
jgi:hypothetical protein